jgi:hypothetical protein
MDNFTRDLIAESLIGFLIPIFILVAAGGGLLWSVWEVIRGWTRPVEGIQS